MTRCRCDLGSLPTSTLGPGADIDNLGNHGPLSACVSRPTFGQAGDDASQLRIRDANDQFVVGVGGAMKRLAGD